MTAASGREERSSTRRSEMAAERLQHAMKHLRARLRSESGQYETGLTATHRAILATVVRHGPVTAARIAELEHVSPQSVGQSLPELKARGLIRSDPDPDDGRKKLISADSSANELIESLMAGRSSFLARAIDQVVSPEEHEDLDQAIGLLERLASADLDGPPGTGCHASALKETSTGRAEPPLPPVYVAAAARNGAVDLTWRASTSKDVGGYLVYYGTARGEYFGNHAIPIDAGNRTSLRIEGLNNGTLYYFAVAAYNRPQIHNGRTQMYLPEPGEFSREAAARPLLRPAEDG